MHLKLFVKQYKNTEEMRLKCITFRGTFLLLSVSALFIAGCTNNKKESEELPPVDSTQSTILNVNGEIFSIPSPIQA